MKHDLDDLTYSRRQRWELLCQILYCMLSAGFLVFIIVKDIPLGLTIVGIATSFVVGVLSVMYGLSRRHRRDHKHLHDMLATLLKQDANRCRTKRWRQRRNAAPQLRRTPEMD